MIAKKLLETRAQNGKGILFEKKEFPKLTAFSIAKVAENFSLFPELEGVEEPYRQKIIDLVDPLLSVKVTAPHIEDEGFWKRACFAKWSNKADIIKIEKHGNSWKVAFLERYISEFLAYLKFDEGDITETKNMLIKEFQAMYKWIFSIELPCVHSLLDFNLISIYLPFLSSLSIHYSQPDSSFSMERVIPGIKAQEVMILADGLKNFSKLVLLHITQLSLQLPCNRIDDDILKLLMNGISLNYSLMHINLAHNNIGDQGARRIAKYLLTNNIIVQIDLSDNLIGYEGTFYLSEALKKNNSLRSLSLKLNKLPDDAGRVLFKDLSYNKCLEDLNLAGNFLAYATAQKLSDYLSDNFCNLKFLDLATNNFSDDCLEYIRKGLSSNFSICKIDIRGNKFKRSDVETELMDIINRHFLSNNKIAFISRVEYIEVKEKFESFSLLNKIGKRDSNQKSKWMPVITIISLKQDF